jgi:RNA polymerase sigma factor (sigma-70 family)
VRGETALGRLEAPESPQTADARVEEKEKQVALEAAVARLPVALAEVYRLRVSGLSYDEIASVLETPVGTVKSRMHDMVRVLREEIEPWTAGK